MSASTATIFTAVSVLLSLVAVGVSVFTFQMQRKDTSYSDIDGTYASLLQIALGDPGLRDYDRTSKYYRLPVANEFRLKYETYAYMVWNMLETIFDRQPERAGRFHIAPTWVPVIIEENRLHYAWFKHNLRLFKEPFQRFVTGSLNDIDVRTGSIADLDTIFNRFERDFPSKERIDRAHLELLMSQGRYHLLLAEHRVFEMTIGYAFLYEPDDPAVIWLDYMAIDERFQSAGYGTLLFNKLAEHRAGSIGVFLEVEKVGSADPEERRDQERRIEFYHRLGAQRVAVDYLYPGPAGGTPMHLYIRPAPGVHMIPHDPIKRAVGSAYEYIHGDVADRDVQLQQFLPQIADTAF